MIKALFFDIDGTLVSFKTHAIPPTTIEAIAAAKAKGIRIFIATGRPAVIINNLSALQDRGLIDGYITMNGGYCFVGEEVIYKSAIPAADVQPLARISSEQNFPCIFVGEHDICVCQPDDMVKKIFNDYLKVDVLPVKTPEEAIRREIREELEVEIEVGPLLGTIEYDYPNFHLSMDTFLAKVRKGTIILKEAEAAKWLTKGSLDTVGWLPADQTIIEKIHEIME